MRESWACQSGGSSHGPRCFVAGLTLSMHSLQGAAHVTRQVLAADGIRGLYRGFGIVVVGIIPARGVRHSAISALHQRQRPCITSWL